MELVCSTLQSSKPQSATRHQQFKWMLPFHRSMWLILLSLLHLCRSFFRTKFLSVLKNQIQTINKRSNCNLDW